MDADLQLLVVDSDKQSLFATQRALRDKGLGVMVASNARQAMSIAKSQPLDLMVVDPSVCENDEVPILWHMRREQIDTPVVVYTHVSDLQEKVRAFALGVEDYIVKPVDQAELVARVSAISRRVGGKRPRVVRTGPIQIELDGQLVHRSDRRIPLTRTEFAILGHLAEQKGRIVSRIDLCRRLYGEHERASVKIIDVYISSLRRKLGRAEDGENFISTVWGSGYLLRDVPR